MSGGKGKKTGWDAGKVWQRVWDVTRDPLDWDRQMETVTGAVQDYKEISGAAATERATEQQRKQFEEQKTLTEKARLEAQNQNARDQMSQSKQAGAARAAGTSGSARSRSAAGGSSQASSGLGADEKDFLGL